MTIDPVRSVTSYMEWLLCDLLVSDRYVSVNKEKKWPLYVSIWVVKFGCHTL